MRCNIALASMLHSLKNLNIIQLTFCLLATTCVAQNVDLLRSLPTIIHDQVSSYKNGILSVASPAQQESKHIEKRQVIGRSDDDEPKEGGQTVQDPDDPKYANEAQEALDQLYSTGGEELILWKVNYVTTQVVAGTVTRLNYTAIRPLGPTDLYDCYAEIWDKPGQYSNKEYLNNVCNVPYESPKSGQGRQGEKDQNNNSSDEPTTPQGTYDNVLVDILVKRAFNRFIEVNKINGENEVVEVKHVNVRLIPIVKFIIDYSAKYNNQVGKCHTEINLRLSGTHYVQNGCDLPGGQTEQDSDDPKYLNMVLQLQRVPVDPKNVKIERVTTQEVRGTITRIIYKVHTRNMVQNCHLKILDAIDGHKELLENACAGSKLSVDRQAHRLGAPVVQDPHKPKYALLAELALSTYLSSHKTDLMWLKSVDYVTEQLVSGVITRLDFTAMSGLTPFACHAEYIQSLNNGPSKFTKNVCVPKMRTSRGGNSGRSVKKVGGLTDEDPRKVEYRILAQDFLNWLARKENRHSARMVLSVNRVRTKIVAGEVTKIDFTSISQNGTTLDCHATIYDKVGPPSREFSGYCGVL